MAKLSRRKLIGAAVVSGAGAGASTSAALEGVDLKTAPISTDDLASADKLAGRPVNDQERKQLLGAVRDGRDTLLAVRTSAFAQPYDPAFVFEPRLANTILPKPGKVRVSRKALPKVPANFEDLAFLSATDLGRLIKARKVSSEALTRMYLERLTKYGPRLLNVVSTCPDRALAEARQADSEIAAGKWRGPLHGVPYGLKDLFAAEGTRTTYGIPPLRDQVLHFDSTVAVRLKEAGAVLVAKLSLGELAMGDVWFGGTTRNPWNPTRGSSGSSAGSASAVAAGLVGFAIGTETYGSIVSPSRVCGTTGLRPTFGRVSRHGAMALSWTMDKVGPICRSVEDCALVFSAIHGPDGYDRTVVEGAGFDWNPTTPLSSLRIGYDRKAFEKARPEQTAVLEHFRKQGLAPRPVDLPANNPAYDALPDLTILTEGAAAFAEFADRGGLRQLVQQSDSSWPNLLRFGATLPAADYLNAQRVRRHLQAAMDKALDGFDVFITPAGSAPSITWTNLTGHPTCITRCGKTSNGLPISVEFTGNLFREDAVLRLAYAWEQASGWNHQWPDMEKIPETPPALNQISSEAED
jgi:Asp-tRNA(Asn)/Glu-tRNA(Gln) amidotransferase A subunit family amidase